jgi:DNA polymerase III sliding clamp (beta) subunit (PCNA family)
MEDTMKAILNRQALQIALAADPGDSGRPILECIKIGNSEIMACDGFVFAKCQITTEPLEGEEILIDAKDIIGAARIIEHGSITVESNDTLVTLRNEDSSISIVTKLQDGKYPNTSELAPKTERKAYVALSKNILSKVLEIAKLSDDVLVKFKVREPSQPVIVTSGDVTIYAMPMFRPENE